MKLNLSYCITVHTYGFYNMENINNNLLNKIRIKHGKVSTYYKHYNAESTVFLVHAMKAYSFGGGGGCSFTLS
jgi:hypothetical protein